MRAFASGMTTAMLYASLAVHAQSGGAASSNASPPTSTVASPMKLASAVLVGRVIKVVGADGSKNPLYVIDNDPNTVGRVLNGATFVAKNELIVTVPKLNPLKMQVTAGASAFDDPSAGTIAKLFDAISGIPAIVKPSPGTNKFVGEGKENSTEAAACPAIGLARDAVNDL